MDALHISLEDLYAYEDGGLEEAARERILSHLSDCALCRQELELLKSFTSVEPETRLPGRSPALEHRFREHLRPAPSRSRRGWAAGLMAAAAALLVAAVLQLTPDPGPDQPGSTLRGDGAAVPSLEAEATAQGWDIRWDPQELSRGRSTRLEVITGAGATVLSRAAGDPPVALSREELSQGQELLFVRLVLTDDAGIQFRSRVVLLD